MSTDPRVAAFALVLRRTRQFRDEHRRPGAGAVGIWFCYARIHARAALLSKAWGALAEAHYAASRTYGEYGCEVDNAQYRGWNATSEADRWNDQAGEWAELAARIRMQISDMRLDRSIRVAEREHRGAAR